MLQNRFPSSVFQFWQGHYTCAICGRNTADQIHHIISPTANCYIKGIHNTSILNSCPLCQLCHINQPLQNNKTQYRLLNYTLNIIALREYQIKEKDNIFYKTYAKVYRTGHTETDN